LSVHLIPFFGWRGFMKLRPLVFGVARALVLASLVACSATTCSELVADDDAVAAEMEHGDAEHGETGVPIGFKLDLALWSLIVFLIFLFVLKKTAWGPMIQGLDKRESGIRAAIAEAEEGQRKSQALLADYEEKLRGAEQTVAEMVAEAKRDAERTSQDIVAKAQAEVESMRERAKEEIGRAKDSALAEVFESVNSRIALATEHVLGRAMSGDDQERLVEEALAEIGA
jgi:F-type H+-transporting ATPase subunit b